MWNSWGLWNWERETILRSLTFHYQDAVFFYFFRRRGASLRPLDCLLLTSFMIYFFGRRFFRSYRASSFHFLSCYPNQSVLIAHHDPEDDDDEQAHQLSRGNQTATPTRNPRATVPFWTTLLKRLCNPQILVESFLSPPLSFPTVHCFFSIAPVARLTWFVGFRLEVGGGVNSTDILMDFFSISQTFPLYLRKITVMFLRIHSSIGR